MPAMAIRCAQSVSEPYASLSVIWVIDRACGVLLLKLSQTALRGWEVSKPRAKKEYWKGECTDVCVAFS